MTVLFWLAVLPGLFLIFRVYRMDKIEKEPISLLILLVVIGAVSTLPIAFFESCLEDLLDMLMDSRGLIYLILDNIFVVALIEEVGKFFVLERCTWDRPSFDYHFDGIVYSVCVGMGFAIAENVIYVFDFGIETAILRAVTAIPAHATFAIFMGYYYGLSKMAELEGNMPLYKKMRRNTFWVPIFLHGIYDLTASFGSWIGSALFIVFVVVLDIVAIKRIKKSSREDRSLRQRDNY